MIYLLFLGWTVFFESEAVRILHGEEAYDVLFSIPKLLE